MTTTKARRAILVQAVQNLLTDDDIADMSAAEKRKVIAAAARLHRQTEEVMTWRPR